MITPIVFLDCETDGIHPGRKAWEIAMIRRDAAGERETSFFLEINLATADPFGLKVGRFYDRHPAGRYIAGHEDGQMHPGDGNFLWAADAALRVAQWTHGAHIVGAVPNFDTETLAPMLREWELQPTWHYHLVDVEALAIGWLQGVAARAIDEAGLRGEEAPAMDRSKAAPPWKSDDISRACGVEPPSEQERHTALGDARWAARLYDAITGNAP